MKYTVYTTYKFIYTVYLYAYVYIRTYIYSIQVYFIYSWILYKNIFKVYYDS